MPEGEDAKAQIVLLALIGYSQYFWDHASGAREELPESDWPSDVKRNIFGVPDGCVLLSDAIAESRSTIYYLSDVAKESFNGRIDSIWGAAGSVRVSWWNQDGSKNFARACETLCTRGERALAPDRQPFDLLAEIDRLIEERESAAKVIDGIEVRFNEDLAAALNFGERARLSSAHYNARIWDKDSKPTLARFEAARALLTSQLTASAAGEWTPDPKGISTSVTALKQIYRRFHSVREVKTELVALLE
jgi:hypothetical protein